MTRSLRTLPLWLLVLLLGSAACASSPPAPPATTTPGPSSCRDIELRAIQRIAPVIAAHRACTQDADCEEVSQGGPCLDHCAARMAHEGDAALEAITSDVGAHECRELAALACKAESPPCMPLPAPACRAGSCQ